MSRYRVLSDDNFHSGVKDDRSEHGIYETAADAIKACQTIVDDSLLWEYQQCATPEGGPTAQQLYDRFADFGVSPFVVGLDGAAKVDFVVKSYARKRAEELTAPGEAAGLLRQTLQERKDRGLAERAMQREAKPEKVAEPENKVGPELGSELESELGPEKEPKAETEQLSAPEIREESSPIARDTEQAKEKAMTTTELPAREAMEFDVV